MHPVNPSENRDVEGVILKGWILKYRLPPKMETFLTREGGRDWGISRSLEANKGKRPIIGPAGKQNLDRPKHFRKREIS